MEAITAAIAIVGLCAIAHRQVPFHFRYAKRGSLVAVGVFAALSAPFLTFQYLGPYKVQDVHPPNIYVSDLLNFVVPTYITKLAPATALRVSAHFTGNAAEEGAYIGIPLLLFVAVSVFVARRRWVTWVALAVAAGAGVLSMGPTLHVDGHVTAVRLPGDVLHYLPFLHNLLPARFASTMTLGVGLLVALGLDQLRRLKWPAIASASSLATLGLAALLPVTDFPAGTSPVYSAFTSGLSCPHDLPKASSGHPPVALVLPGVNELDLRWQAESGFCFVLPTSTGMTGTNSTFRQNLGVLRTLGDAGQPVPPLNAATRAQVARELQQFDIKEIVVGPEFPTEPYLAPQGQAELVAWVQALLGQAPLQSHDPYISYVWKDLPPTSAIASGEVGKAASDRS